MFLYIRCLEACSPINIIDIILEKEIVIYRGDKEHKYIIRFLVLFLMQESYLDVLLNHFLKYNKILIPISLIL